MAGICGNTKVYGIIGQPVTHSLSPVFQNYWLQEAGIDAVYVPFPVANGNAKAALDGLHIVGVQGLNVTVPFKEDLLPYVHADARVQAIGALNTIVRRDDGQWHATNTDYLGVRAAIDALVGSRKQPESIMVFGAGGTSRAILYALHALPSVTHVYFCNRSEDRAQSLLADAKASYPGLCCEYIPWEQEAVASMHADVWIQATSLGLHDGDVFPFIPTLPVLGLDMVYRPDGNTLFCQQMRACQMHAMDGLYMLIAQGHAAFQYWHGIDIQIPSIGDTLHWLAPQLGRADLSFSQPRV